MDACNFCFLLLLIIYFKTDLVCCLECWVCVGENCDVPPREKHGVKINRCKAGQSCQKVEYFGLDQDTQTEYHSVVRSCSQAECRPRRDNCTESLITNPGCTHRVCCDQHLCNVATAFYSTLLTPLVSLILQCLDH